MYVGRFAGVEPGIFCEIFYRLGAACCGTDHGSARDQLAGSACGSVVFNLCHAWVRLGYSYQNFRRRVGITSGSDKADFCTSEFVWMSSTLWNDQKLFLTTLKIRVSPKKLVFCDERGSDTNCWWEKPLVVALKHSEGIKHNVLFQQ